MKKLHLQFVLFLLILTVGVAQEKLDILYLKNGNVLKGVIIENVPNDHVRIELSGGSLITVKYSDITKFLRESPPPEKLQPSSESPAPIRIGASKTQNRQEERPKEPEAFRRGVYQLSGGMTFSKNTTEGDFSNSKETAYSFYPGVSYFIADGILLGLEVNYGFFKTEYNNLPGSEVANSEEQKHYGVGGSAHYYFSLANPAPFFGVAIGYQWSETSLGFPSITKSLMYEVELGISFLIAPRTSLEPFVQYQVLTSQYVNLRKSTTQTVGIRVAYYLYE